MADPNFDCIPAVRTQIEEGLEKLRTACTIMRRNGLTENADELMRTVKHGFVWVQEDGWLDCLEKPAVKEAS
jgi:uncharacterized protein (DUF2461 family)